MDKSEDLCKNIWNIWNIQNTEQMKQSKIEDDITDHKTHTHSNGQLPLASKSLALSSHTAFILTPLAKPNNIESMQI